MSSSHETDPQTIRAEIENTHRQIDGTLESLEKRMQPRHLVDEFLGYLRGADQDGKNRFDQVRDQIAHSCGAAVDIAVTAVKRNPVPTFLIGGGVFWLVFQSRRGKSNTAGTAENFEGSEVKSEFNRPLEYPVPDESKAAETPLSGGTEAGSTTSVDSVSSAGECISPSKDVSLEAGTSGRTPAAARPKEKKLRGVYERARTRVAMTHDAHPLGVGLAALGVGVVLGLAVPTPSAVHRTMGETAEKLRDRAKQKGATLLQKSKHVGEAAIDAAKSEAVAQGLVSSGATHSTNEESVGETKPA